jgi:hypothetical protein
MLIDVKSSRECTVCKQEFKEGDDIGMLWIGLPDDPEPEGEAHKSCIRESDETQRRIETDCAAFLKKVWEESGRRLTDETDFVSVFQNVSNNINFARNQHPSRFEVRLLDGCDGSDIFHFVVRPINEEIRDAERGRPCL